MKKLTFAVLIFAFVGCTANESVRPAGTSPLVSMSPKNQSSKVNPDTHLALTFSSAPTIGTSGLIRIYDAADRSLVDTLDMSIPVSPAPNGRAPPRIAGDPNSGPAAADPNDKTVYQVNMIAGVDVHFFPIIVHGNIATIYPHNNVLKYGHTYIVKMDPSVLKPATGNFEGFKTDTDWTFSTKAAAPPANTQRVVVADDGSGDFNTVQGAIDFVPAKPAKRTTVFIKNGDYEEIVFIRDKAGILLRGESRDRVQVGYRNNSAFNPSKAGPSRRPAFSILDSSDIELSRFTINNYFIGQAEALLIRGQRIVVDHMTLNGSGDALTTYGTIYMVDSKLTGHGDSILGYAALFCLRCEIDSIGPMTWTRTPKGSHGNVFVNSTFVAIDKPLPWTVTPTDPGQKSKSVFARLPRNNPGTSAPNFPYAEMVLIDCKTQGVSPEGWSPIEEAPGFDSSNVHFWEYNTRDMENHPIDTSKRHPVVRQLTLPRDAQIIADYSKPEFVLDGWKPVVE
jgi:pectinesterase